MKKSRKYLMHSIQKDARILFLILIPILIVNIFISYLASSTASAQSQKHAEEVMDMYLDTLENQIESIERFVIWTTQHEGILTAMNDTGHQYMLTEGLYSLRSRISDFQSTLSQKYQFFLYLNKQDFFTNCSPLLVNYSDYLEIRSYYKELIRSGERLPFHWNMLKTGDTYYLYYLITVDNRSLLCQITLEDLLSPLKDLDLGDSGYLHISADERDFFIQNNRIQIQAPDTPFYSRYMVYQRQDSRLPFSIQIYMDRFSAFQKIIILQLAVVITAVTLILLLGILLFYMHRRVLRPIKEFSANLASINENTDLLNLQSNNIIELEQAHKQFKNLMREIKKLKINIYENELEKKRIQIDFMKLQIRPHFYLNCLTCIHSMAQTQLYEEIGQMALSTAKYLRYLLQDNQDFVNLNQEIEHVEDYLSIQKLRYGEIFTYLCEISPDVKDVYIPPLILQTFIENVINHAISPDEMIKINLTIKKVFKDQKDYLKIQISNTGTGFPDEVLSTLNSGLSLEHKDGTHIGITNVIQRLHLLYDEDFSIYFNNLPDGGALVTVVLPYQPINTEVFS